MRNFQTLLAALLLLALSSCGVNGAENEAAKVEPTPNTESVELLQSLPNDTLAIEPVADSDKAVAESGVESAVQAEQKPESEPESEKNIPVKHLLWLFIPAAIIAVLGFVCGRVVKAAQPLTEKSEKAAKWLVYSVLALFVVEAVMAGVLLWLGVLNMLEPGTPIAIFIISLLFMLLNAYGALATNSAILRRYQIAFSWKKISIYLAVTAAIVLIFALVVPHIFEISVFDSRMVVPNLLVAGLALAVMFSVDMYKQNSQSLRVIPVILVLFTIGVVMSGVWVLIALVAIGAWHMLKSYVEKERAEQLQSAPDAAAEQVEALPEPTQEEQQ